MMEKEYTTIHFVANDEIKAYLEARAKKEHRNISACLRVIIEEQMRTVPVATTENGHPRQG